MGNAIPLGNTGPLTLKELFESAEKDEQDNLLLYMCPKPITTSIPPTTTSSTTTTTTSSTTMAPLTCPTCPPLRCPKPKPCPTCPSLLPQACPELECDPCSADELVCPTCVCPPPKRCVCPRCDKAPLVCINVLSVCNRCCLYCFCF